MAGVRRAEGPQPGFGEAPQRAGIMVGRRAHGRAAPIAGQEAQPGGGALLIVAKVGNECGTPGPG